MGLLDDYQDEMERLDSDQIDAILSRQGVNDAEGERARALVRDLRDALLEDPSPEVARRHLEAMSAAVPSESGHPTTLQRRRTPMRILSRRRIVALPLAAVLVLAVGIAAAVTLPPQADDTAKTQVPADPDVLAGQPEGVPPAQAEHGQTVSGIAQDVDGCDDALDLAEIASGGRLDRGGLPVDPCAQADEQAAGSSGSNGGGGGSGPGGGGGGGGGGAGGGGGGGSSVTGAGGSGSGGPGGGGGGGSGPGGGGGGSGGPGGGSGGGGPTSSTEAPTDLPTPGELPTP